MGHFNMKKFINRIKTIFAYLPLLWNDHDWDHDYLYELIKKKLERKLKYFQNNKITYEDDRTIKELSICIHLLNRIIDDKYSETKRAEYLYSIINKNKQDSLNRNLHKYYFEYVDQRKQDDLDLLFTIMKRKSLTWWN